MVELSWLASVVTGLVGLFVGSLLNETKGYREKVWERRARAYSEILESVGEMSELLDLWLVVEMVDIQREKEADEEERLKYHTAKERVFRAISREQWVLPARDLDRLDKFKKQLMEKQPSYFEHLDNALHACLSLIKDLTELARTEMVDGVTTNFKRPTWRLGK